MNNAFVIFVTFVFTIGLFSFANCLSVSESMTYENRQRKLLIDTDAGADDAIAMIIALENEKLNNGPEIIGITCVNGNADVDRVALNVLKTLKVLDRINVPVYKGASHPLLLPDHKDYYFGQDSFGDFDYPDPPSINLIQKKHAVNAMIDLVEKYPGEITLVCLGPLTNVALAIRMYPKFLKNLNDLIILGGSTEGIGNVAPGIEYNFAADPLANYIVLNSSISKPVALISWETTQRVNLTMAFRQSLGKLNNSKSWFINSIESVSLKPENEYWFSADPVAMVVALNPKSMVTKYQNYYSDAIYDGTKTSGMIIVDYTNITGRIANTKLVQDIDVNGYKNLLEKCISN